jgi:FkbH-like protein
LSVYNHENLRSPSYDKLLELIPGYNNFNIPFSDIENLINLEGAFSIKIEVMTDGEHNLYFGIIDFIQTNAEKASSIHVKEANKVSEKKIKCVIWDLDNTVWSGTLIEDGLDGLKLNANAVKVMHELERRGILNSAASKNNQDDALNALAHFGLDNVFLYPQISWEPKSASVKNIQTALNIGMDAIAFIDDQPFEREEVKSVYPQIHVFDDNQIPSLLSDVRFDVPVTQESAQRKKMYQQEIQRIETYQSSSVDYENFLKNCDITLELNTMTDSTVKRAYELAQRTNQMNFSGNRYSIDELINISSQNNKKIILISASDKFGNYGIVGMVILDTDNNCIEDLMFSCRIQSKMVDHAILTFLIRENTKNGQLSIKYRESQKNIAASKIFDDMGFVVVSDENGVKTLVYPASSNMPSNHIISINDNMAGT